MLKNLVNKFATTLGYEVSVYPVGKSKYQTPKTGIVFVHIPKCGGISIDKALRSKLANPGERRIDRQALIHSNLNAFDREISSIEDACDFNEFHCEENKRILRYHLSQNWRYISGHLTVDQSILQYYKQSHKFVTVLREPKARFISNYLYNKLTNTNKTMLPNNHENLTVDGAINEAKTIIQSRRGWHIANTLSLFITGSFPKDKQDALAREQLFAKNIELFSAVGFLDDLPAFCQKIDTLLDIKPVSYTHLTLPTKRIV